MERAQVILLDSHVLVWADTNERRLGRKSRALLERAWKVGRVAVSAISFWELAILQSRRRICVAAGLGDWRAALIAAGLREIALDGNVALRATELSGPAADPADRFILATALVHQAELLTADETLLDFALDLRRHDARE